VSRYWMQLSKMLECSRRVQVYAKAVMIIVSSLIK